MEKTNKFFFDIMLYIFSCAIFIFITRPIYLYRIIFQTDSFVKKFHYGLSAWDKKRNIASE